jgi:hypothetical protein
MLLSNRKSISPRYSKDYVACVDSVDAELIFLSKLGGKNQVVSHWSQFRLNVHVFFSKSAPLKESMMVYSPVLLRVGLFYLVRVRTEPTRRKTLRMLYQRDVSICVDWVNGN